MIKEYNSDGMKPTYWCDHSWSRTTVIMFDKAKIPRTGFTKKSEIVQSDSTLKILQSSISREPDGMPSPKRHFYIKVLNIWFLKKTVCHVRCEYTRLYNKLAIETEEFLIFFLLPLNLLNNFHITSSFLNLLSV